MLKECTKYYHDCWKFTSLFPFFILQKAVLLSLISPPHVLFDSSTSKTNSKTVLTVIVATLFILPSSSIATDVFTALKVSFSNKVACLPYWAVKVAGLGAGSSFKRVSPSRVFFFNRCTVNSFGVHFFVTFYYFKESYGAF